MHNFTIADCLGMLKAGIALAPFMVAPGFAIGWMLDLFDFRHRRLILQFLIAVPLSVSICPMLSYMLGRFFPLALWGFYLATITVSTVLLFPKLKYLRLRTISKYEWGALGLVTLWIIVCLAWLTDLQLGNELYPPIEAFDHSARAEMTAALARHIPPDNPLFANASAPLRYHYLWLLFCSLPMRILHLSARHVMYAGVIWCGIALMCAVALGLKFLSGIQSDIERKCLLGIGLLSITGLDILPVLYLGLKSNEWLADTETWNGNYQITSWVGSLLWVPHNVAALVACFVAFLLLRQGAEHNQRWITAPVVISGMAFASAIGMSVYVAFTFVVFGLLWLLGLIVRKEWREVASLVCAGVVAAVWALHFVLSLRGAATGGAFIEFALRQFPLGVAAVRRLGIELQSPVSLVFANALFLPLNYALELGFFFAVAILRLWQVRRGEIDFDVNEQAAWTLVTTAFLIGTFLRSSTINNNDLGWRCFLPAQLILLLWAVDMIYAWFFDTAGLRRAPGFWGRQILAICLAIGTASTIFQMFMLRSAPMLTDRGSITATHWVVSGQHFGRRAFALRSVYESTSLQLPPSAVLQRNPASRNIILHMLYSGHDEAAGNFDCWSDFGGDSAVCKLRVQSIVPIFFLPAADVDSVCRDYEISAVVVEDQDPVWQDPSSWVWSRQPLAANDFVRVIRCGVGLETSLDQH